MGRHHLRLKPTKKRNTIFVFVCEGKTERIYFEGFQSHVSGLKIHTPPTNDTDPLGLVEHAKKQIRKLGLNLEDKDKIVCVFDCDPKDFKDEVKARQLFEAVKEAEQQDIGICFSNPSFEVWPLSHFTTIPGEPILTKEGLEDRLQRYLPNYEKGCDYFDESYPKIYEAIENSTSLMKFHEKNGTILVSIESNPYTSVFKIVKEILDFVP